MPFAAMPVGWKLHSESYDPDVSQCRQVDLEGAVASTTLDHTPGNEASQRKQALQRRRSTATTPTGRRCWALRALAFQRFSAYLAKSRDFQDTCARHLEFGTRHPRDYELLYGRGWMERVTAEAQGGEIERYTTHLVRAGVDKSNAANVAYPIKMLLHCVVMHRLLNKKPSPLGRAIA